jgi:hypothetical protein
MGERCSSQKQSCQLPEGGSSVHFLASFTQGRTRYRPVSILFPAPAIFTAVPLCYLTEIS